jgi:hypothetical protein
VTAQAKPEDQKTATSPVTGEATKAGDQKRAPKRVVKEGSTVDRWQKSNKAGEFKSGTIRVIQPYVDESHPKRKAAGVRYRLYRDGMSVEDYQKAVVEQKLNTPAGVLSDIRWDVAKGLIRVE